MPLVYSFHFTRFPHDTGWTFRPILYGRLRGPLGTAPVDLLVDSGADCSVIDLALAERLGLELSKIHKGRGVSGPVPVRRGRMILEIRHASRWLTPIAIPVEVPARGAPPFAILGREVVFSRFDILFQLGPVPERGMFHLVPHESPRSRVPRHRAGIRRRNRAVAT